MTHKHPITPPPELQEEWLGLWPQDALLQAARWGADMELEACCDWVLHDLGYEIATRFQAARRPKPPSLAEEALAVLDDTCYRLDAAHENIIRHALERLQELEGQGDD